MYLLSFQMPCLCSCINIASCNKISICFYECTTFYNSPPPPFHNTLLHHHQTNMSLVNTRTTRFRRKDNIKKNTIIHTTIIYWEVLDLRQNTAEADRKYETAFLYVPSLKYLPLQHRYRFFLV